MLIDDAARVTRRRGKLLARSLATFAACLLAVTAAAHPVAQGSLEVTIAPHELKLRASVTLEEVLVATAYGAEAARPMSPAEAAQRHGPYLLEHLRVRVDGQTLRGRLLPASAPQTQPNRFIYEFEFPLEQQASEIQLEQDVLNEFEFAPGNRWEASYAVRIIEEGHPPREGLLLTSGQPLTFQSAAFSRQSGAPPRVDRWQVLCDYAHHGILHILTGYDHLLFVTALVLAVRGLWDLIKVITAFTVAHSITLAISALDLLRLPSSFVEPVIAASIIFVAVQNIFWPEHTHGWARLAVAFFFGLFHGLGFAGGLLDAMHEMAATTFVLALVGFSAGVEIGHQVVVLPLFLVLYLARVSRKDESRSETRGLLVSRWGSAAISLAGLFYLIGALTAP